MTPLNVLGTDYDLVLCDKKWKSTGSPGTVNFPHAKIYLDTDLDDDRIVDVLMHEIFEIIKDRFTINELSHISLCAFELGVSRTLKDNPIMLDIIALSRGKTEGNTYEFEDFKKLEEAAGGVPTEIPKGKMERILRKLKEKKKKSRKNRKKKKA
jgi:hypothetical protein